MARTLRPEQDSEPSANRKSGRMRLAPRVWIPLSVLVGAFLVAFLLSIDGPEVAEAPDRPMGTLVAVDTVRRSLQRIDVEAQGTVMPASQVALTPEVGGTIVSVSPNLVPGGRVRSGELLVRLDPREFRLAVDEARTGLLEARSRLEQEEGRRRVAEREWELFRDEQDTAVADRELALRQPQLDAARAQVRAAQSRLERAQLNLERTAVRAPFDALVRSAQAEPGQAVTPQAPLATLAASSHYWISASLPVEHLNQIAIPGFNAPSDPDSGSLVQVHQEIGGVMSRREGRVLRLYPGLDTLGRMARLLVQVDDPLLLDAADESEIGGDDVANGNGAGNGAGDGTRDGTRDGGDPSISGKQSEEIPGARSESAAAPLLLNSYVSLRVVGREEQLFLTIPRAALREGDRVFVVAPDTTLSIRSPDIAWRTDEFVLVRQGLSEGELVVVSQLAAPVEGMRLRLPQQGAQAEPEAPGVRPSGAAPASTPPEPKLNAHGLSTHRAAPNPTSYSGHTNTRFSPARPYPAQAVGDG